MSIAESQCMVHDVGFWDGECTCQKKCDKCGMAFTGIHSKDDCIEFLVNKLKIMELATKIEALVANRVEPSRETMIATAKAALIASLPPKVRSCNRHSDCDAAEQEVMTRTGKKRHEISSSFHCHDDECEDCFGC